MLFKKTQATPMPYPNELANILNKQAALDAKQRLANWSLLNPEKILLGKYREQLKDFAVIGATDGNHGRALVKLLLPASKRTLPPYSPSATGVVTKLIEPPIVCGPNKICPEPLRTSTRDTLSKTGE